MHTLFSFELPASLSHGQSALAKFQCTLSLVSHALRACEARALRARKTLTPRFTDFFTDFEKKPTVLQSTLELSIDNNVRLEQLVGEKLLGVVIDPKLSWDLHIDFLIKKLTSRLCS